MNAAAQTGTRLVSPADRDIALCLSGGGLRATLFHFGLLKAMRVHERSGKPAIGSIREIFSVSGGSIIAAHLVAHWDAYNGDEAAFQELESVILAFAGRNVRDRVVRRSLVARFGARQRGYWLQKEYENLVAARTLAECYAPAGAAKPPVLHILATSFTTGELCSFSGDQFEVEPNQPTESKHVAPAGHLPLAYAVAASSAFPPLFPPIALTAAMLRQPDDRRFQETIRLSDGGVFDNLGYEKFRSVHSQSTVKAAALITSNAGGAFHSGLDKAYANVVSRNVRASDILMRRIADATAKDIGNLTGLDIVDVRIGADVPDSAVLPATQRMLRLVRTDLDRFDENLAGMLIDHGYRVGCARLEEKGWQRCGEPLPLTCSPEM